MYLPLSLSSFSLFLISLSLSTTFCPLSHHISLLVSLSLSHHVSLTVAYIDRCLSCEVPLGTTVQCRSGGGVDLVGPWAWWFDSVVLWWRQTTLPPMMGCPSSLMMGCDVWVVWGAMDFNGFGCCGAMVAGFWVPMVRFRCLDSDGFGCCGVMVWGVVVWWFEGLWFWWLDSDGVWVRFGLIGLG